MCVYLVSQQALTKQVQVRKFNVLHYTDGDFWRREHHGMYLSRGLKWYWGKIISPDTKSRDL